MNYPGRVIKKDETNKTIVKAVQAQLNMYGCGPLTTDGDYGNKTFNAVKLFQSMHKDKNNNPLEIDGKIGSITWQILFGNDTILVADTAPNNLLTDAVAIAVSQIGVMEDPVGSNSGKIVNAYLASVSLSPGLYWCAAFVYWCFNKACETTYRQNPLIKTGGCMDHWNNATCKKITSADAVNNPALVKPGQIFIINTGGSHGHTGIIEKTEGGFIYTIEGNTNTNGSSNGIGVFRNTRKITKINRGFLEYK